MTNRRAWVWTAVILGGMAIVGGFGGAFLSRGSVFKPGFSAGFKSAFLSHFGVNSPAGKEVAKVGKCQNASIVSGEDIGSVGDAGVLDMDFVICILPVKGDEPNCDDLARAYVDTAHPTRKFMIEVKHLTGDHMTCQRTYDETGTLITNYSKK